MNCIFDRIFLWSKLLFLFHLIIFERHLLYQVTLMELATSLPLLRLTVLLGQISCSVCQCQNQDQAACCSLRPSVDVEMDVKMEHLCS